MTEKPPKSGGFAALVGQVEALPKGAARVTPKASRGRGVAVKAPRAALQLEQIGENVVAYRADFGLRKAQELRSVAAERRSVAAERSLDLHRMNTAKALAALHTAVGQARRDGVTMLRVLVGRGSHSGGSGPVLPRVVVEALSGPLADAVLGFSSASAEHGGSGALIVRLRRGA